MRALLLVLLLTPATVLANDPLTRDEGPRPHVTSGAAKVVAGALPAIRAERVYQRHVQQLLACFAAVLRVEPTAKGKLVVEVAIRADGRVESAETVADSVGGNLRACVPARMRKWRFGKLPGPAKVRYSLVFVSKS